MCPINPASTTPSPSKQSVGFHVLIVTEDPMLLSTFTRGLFRFGHRTTQASSPHSAWELLCGPVAIAADAVVVDLTRPHPGCRDLVLKITDKMQNLPIIVLCGLQDEACKGLESNMVTAVKVARNAANFDMLLRHVIMRAGGILRRLRSIPALPAPMNSDRGSN